MKRIVMALTSTILLSGCANQSEEETATPQPDATVAAAKPETKPAQQKAAAVPHYVVESREIRAPIKAVLTLRIDKKYTEDQIRAIAQEVKATLPQNLERVFLFYLTPGMKDGAGAYATSHYNPELKVEMLGLSEAQTKALAAKPVSDPSIMGRWENHIMKCIYTLRKRNGRYFMEMKFSDGSSGEDEVFTRKLNGHQGYSETFAEGDGYYVIEPDGKLTHRTMQGMELYVYLPVK